MAFNQCPEEPPFTTALEIAIHDAPKITENETGKVNSVLEPFTHPYPPCIFSVSVAYFLISAAPHCAVQKE